MNGCIYKTADGQCEKFSDKTRNIMSWCVGDEPCEGRMPSNADRIRAMTDEELAFLIGNGCPPACVEPCREYLSVGGDTNCTDCWLDWLKSPVEVVE